MDYFLLYPEAIRRFVEQGGILSWGIIPTGDLAGKEAVEGLSAMILKALCKFEEWGMDPQGVARHSLLTPSCGMGMMDESRTLEVLDLLSSVSKKCADLA